MTKKKQRPNAESRKWRRSKTPPPPMPLVLYAVKGDGDDPTFFARATFTDSEIDDGEVVGIYDLREVRTMVITRGLR